MLGCLCFTVAYVWVSKAIVCLSVFVYICKRADRACMCVYCMYSVVWMCMCMYYLHSWIHLQWSPQYRSSGRILECSDTWHLRCSGVSRCYTHPSLKHNQWIILNNCYMKSCSVHWSIQWVNSSFQFRWRVSLKCNPTPSENFSKCVALGLNALGSYL